MKILKKIFYFIAGLIILVCVFILICALNPSLTDLVSKKLNDFRQSLSGKTVSDNDMGDVWQHVGEEIGIDWDRLLAEDEENIYVIPEYEKMEAPLTIANMGGLEEIAPEEDLVEEKEEEIPEGELGDNLFFDTTLYPYYAMLNEDMQKLYRQIYANANSLNKSFAPIVNVNTTQLRNVFEAVYNDHPELFWLETAYSCKYMSNGQCVEVMLNYNKTASYLAEAKEQFEKQAQKIIVQAKEAESDLDKAAILHDLLAEQVTYELKSVMNQSAYSAMVNKESVCSGYARAYQYLCQQVGIPCYYCTGYAGQSHAWNIVKINDNYFNIDTTWDDTDPVTKDFFLKDDGEFGTSHRRTGLSVYLPACAGIKEPSEMDALINPNPNDPISYP